MTRRAGRAALYCRLSRRPDTGKVMTVAEQEKALRAEAERQGLDVVGVYIDNGVSAFKRVKRPGFLELVASIERREVSHVLTVALDRATRRVADLAMIREAAEDAGAVIVADGKTYHPTDDALSLYLFGIVAEQESRDKSRRVLAAKARALELGLYQGGKRPLGFRKVEGAARGWWEQDPAEAVAIRKGAEMVLDGASLVNVARLWNDQGLSTSSASNPFSAAKVRRALLSPIVAGLRTHKGEAVGPLTLPNGEPWPAILTPAEQDDIARALASRYGNKPKRWHTPNPGLLSGLATCGHCGHTLTPRRYGGKRADGYTCQADGGGRCGGVGITMHRVDDDITTAVLDLLSRSPKVRRAMRAPAKPKKAGPDPAALQADLDLLADAAGRGEVSMREYLRARKPLEERLKAARALDVDDDRGRVLAGFIDDPRAAWESADLERRHAVLAALLDSVEISPATSNQYDPKRVKPRWKA